MGMNWSWSYDRLLGLLRGSKARAITADEQKYDEGIEVKYPQGCGGSEGALRGLSTRLPEGLWGH